MSKPQAVTIILKNGQPFLQEREWPSSLLVTPECLTEIAGREVALGDDFTIDVCNARAQYRRAGADEDGNAICGLCWGSVDGAAAA